MYYQQQDLRIKQYDLLSNLQQLTSAFLKSLPSVFTGRGDVTR